MPTVFVSYAHDSEGRAVVRQIVAALRAHGVDVFFDGEFATGDSRSSRVSDALDRSDAVVALLSRASSESPSVAVEWSGALARRKPVLPVQIERNAKLPALLAPYVTLDASDPTTRPEKIESLATQISSGFSGLSRESDIALIQKTLVDSRKLHRLTFDALDLSTEKTFRNISVFIMLACTVLAVLAVLFATMYNWLEIVRLILPGLLGGTGAVVASWALRHRRNVDEKEILRIPPEGRETMARDRNEAQR